MMPFEIECYAIGTKIISKSGGVEGIITAIVVRMNHFVYNISCLANGEFKDFYMYEYEFEVVDAEKVKIGFRSNGVHSNHLK